MRGIDEEMDTETKPAFTNERIFICFTAEAVMQCLRDGSYVDPIDVSRHFKAPPFRNLVLAECRKHEIG